MLPLKTESEFNAIVKNIVSYCNGKNKRLTKPAYQFISCASGFIAHYDVYGFMREYNGKQLTRAIIRNHGGNQWRNFTPLDKDYLYYMQKKALYNAIYDKLLAY
jgi:hypothetical protein